MSLHPKRIVRNFTEDYIWKHEDGHRCSTKKLPMLSIKPLAPANCLPKLQSSIPGPQNSTCSPKFIRLVILDVQSFQLVTAQPPTSLCTLIWWWLLLWDNYQATWKTQITRFESWNRLLFQAQGYRYLFTMVIKSLYTVIPNNSGLQALKYYLNLHPSQHPPTDALVQLAELVLNLNSFEFDNKHYQQVGGIAMGTKMGPNYACLFVGYVERKMFEDYKGNKTQLYKRYIDDVFGASSGTWQNLENSIEFCSAYHPSLKCTFGISESSFSVLNLCLSISDARITTTICYKPTDTHSSSHPLHCKKAIPYSQFLCLRRICWDNDEYVAKSKEMASFFENREYPRSVVTNSQRQTQEISRERALGNSGQGDRVRCSEKIPLVLTYHSKIPSLFVYIGGIQVSETSWFIALCRVVLMIPKPHQRGHFLAIDPSAARVTSREGRQRSPMPTEMFR